MGFLQDLGNTLMGTGKDSGFLGIGQYKPDQYKINEQGFTDNLTSRSRIGNLLREKKALGTTETMGDKARADQMNFINALQQQAAGQGPSLAEAQLQSATDKNIAAANAMAASSRGISPALAQRMAQQRASDAQLSAGQQAAQARIQEQMMARQQLGAALANMRGQDIQSQAQQDLMSRYYTSGVMGLEDAERQRLMDLERLKAQQAMGYGQIGAQSYENASNRRAGFLGAIGSALMGA